MKKLVKAWMKKACPSGLWYYLQHVLIVRHLGDRTVERSRTFGALVHDSTGKRCLQIGARDEKYAPHWTCVDLYDKAPYVDFNYDVHDLKFPDASFDIAVCNAVLEHIDDPPKAIRELGRVLAPGGLIWVEVPFTQQYHPCPHDHWRVSPTGLRIWMRDFEELASGLFTAGGSPIHCGSFFYGRKR